VPCWNTNGFVSTSSRPPAQLRDDKKAALVEGGWCVRSICLGPFRPTLAQLAQPSTPTFKATRWAGPAPTVAGCQRAHTDGRKSIPARPIPKHPVRPPCWNRLILLEEKAVADQCRENGFTGTRAPTTLRRLTARVSRWPSARTVCERKGAVGFTRGLSAPSHPDAPDGHYVTSW